MIRRLRGETSWDDYVKEIQDEEKKIAIIDDCTMDGLSRECRPAISMAEMCDVLQEQRFRKDSPVPNADIRRMCHALTRSARYAPDITFITSLCIADNASPLDKRVLAEFFQRHLTAEPVIDPRKLSDGDQAFAFEYHYPHLVLRRGRGLLEDNRTTPGNKPLRSLTDITFLRDVAEDTEGLEMDYLYQATTSCLVIGHHSLRWTAYMFTDTYFSVHDDTAMNEESMHLWSEERKESGRPDPFTFGETQADTPLLNARDFWVNSAATRLRRVLQESSLAVSHICEKIDKHLLDNRALALPRSNSFKESKDDASAHQDTAKKNIAARRNALTWLNEASLVVDEVMHSLRDNVTQLSLSDPIIREMFCDGKSGRGNSRERHNIRNARAAEMADLKRRLDRLVERLIKMRARLDNRVKDAQKAVRRTSR
ncbi:uncharacterized protein B0I36DRAFT_349977 [Microdochium trichocladiopsis]|uniref:Uncharacterized protein n=1 Tax=Microdochium trichocladiopsis TaxID=1682393 RepID=A0A9P8Y6G6_9PEZI|nr:uncharacterized protein B0I36DRAFT_349977 [Microdochium trichocladiopsis]KAH7029031.1 hypothetical protein B0I36DRAFT_349977 [Microdochium trichocladiopsis]